MPKPLMQANLFKDMVNKLRDCGAAYHAHQSLRERISGIVHEYILPASKTQVADLESLRSENVSLKLEQSMRKMAEQSNAKLLIEIRSLKTELEAARMDAEKLKLLGEMRDGAVIWFSTNPHGWPDGTRYYAAIEQASSCNELHEKGGA